MGDAVKDNLKESIQELTPHQKRFVLLSLAAFAAVLIAAALVISLALAHSTHPKTTPASVVLAEPVDYDELYKVIAAHEREGLEIYRANSDGTAQVPIERALEILSAHPEGLNL